MSSNEFSERMFAAGSVVGIRDFDVDSLGRLRGITHTDVFKPGVNEGRCSRGSMLTFRHVAASLGLPPTAARALGVRTTPNITDPEIGHVVGALDCTCGYYAYFDGANDYGSSRRVTAIIEGFGVTTVGTRGFRSAKARLVALVLPTQRLAWYHRLARWMDDVAGPLGFAIGVLGAIWGVIGGIALLDGGHTVWGTLLLALTPLFVLTLLASMHGVDCEHDGSVQLVRRNYPDVPVYRTKRAALAAHPLSPLAKEPSPADEDFWTREAS